MKKYIYAVSGKKAIPKDLIGLANEKVSQVNWRDISAIISNIQLVGLSSDGLKKHMAILDTLFKEELTLLPFRYGITSSSEEEVKSLLKRNYFQWASLLKKFEGKAELSVRVFWKDFEKIILEILKENKDLQYLKEKQYYENNPRNNYFLKIRMGETFIEYLEKKKQKEAQEIFGSIEKIFEEYKQNKLIGDRNLANWAFLINKNREREFDSEMKKLAKKYQAYDFKYFGPSSPFNFV